MALDEGFNKAQMDQRILNWCVVKSMKMGRSFC